MAGKRSFCGRSRLILSTHGLARSRNQAGEPQSLIRFGYALVAKKRNAANPLVYVVGLLCRCGCAAAGASLPCRPSEPTSAPLAVRRGEHARMTSIQALVGAQNLS